MSQIPKNIVRYWNQNKGFWLFWPVYAWDGFSVISDPDSVAAAGFWLITLPICIGNATIYLFRWLIFRKKKHYYWLFASMFLVLNVIVAFWTPEHWQTKQWKITAMFAFFSWFLDYGTPYDSADDE